jgi:hypothetical protein
VTESFIGKLHKPLYLHQSLFVAILKLCLSILTQLIIFAHTGRWQWQFLRRKSLITDGDYSMMKAIRQVLPGVNHLEENLPKHIYEEEICGSLYTTYVLR